MLEQRTKSKTSFPTIHTEENDALRKAGNVNISILRLLFQAKMSNLISKYRAVANFNDYIEKKGINHFSKHKLKFPFTGFGLCFCSNIN